jgi:Mg-chelatase subunit ChlD
MKCYLGYNSVFHLIIYLCLQVHEGELLGQATSLELSSNTIDLGKIASTSNLPKVIHFKNISEEKLAILLIEKGPDVTIRFERRFYLPGEDGIITFYYNPRTTGTINEEIRLFNNIDTIPQLLHLTGNVVSVLECFPDPENLLKRSIKVIDSTTKEPVPEAQLEMIHNHNSADLVKIKVNREGKAIRELPIGLYNVTASASNYYPLVTEFFLPKSQPNIILEMVAMQRGENIQTNKPAPQIVSEITEKRIEYPDLPEDRYVANNIILLLDVSSSMKSNKKFILLQQAINNLIMILRPFDYISLITYSNEAITLLQSVPGNEKEKIIGTVETLVPYGITKGVKGLNAAYELARSNYIKGGNNLIILATDGEFSETNIPDTYYEELIAGFAKQQIYMSVFGFGVNEEAIKRMQKMTVAGDGSFILIESEEQTKDFLIEEIKKRSFISSL